MNLINIIIITLVYLIQINIISCTSNNGLPNFLGLFTESFQNGGWQYTTIDLTTGNINITQEVTVSDNNLFLSIVNVSSDQSDILSLWCNGNSFSLVNYNSLSNEFYIESNITNEITFDYQLQPITYVPETNKAYFVSSINVAFSMMTSIIELNFKTRLSNVIPVRTNFNLGALPIGVYDAESNVFFSYLVDDASNQFIVAHSIATQRDFVNQLVLPYYNGDTSLFFYNNYLYLCQISSDDGQTSIQKINTDTYAPQSIYSKTITYFDGMMNPFYLYKNYIAVFDQDDQQQSLSIDFLNLDDGSITTSSSLNSSIPKSKEYIGTIF